MNETNASILIFNLNGQTLKEYKLTEAKGTITIDANVLTKGLYLYSLINGVETATTFFFLINKVLVKYFVKNYLKLNFE